MKQIKIIRCEDCPYCRKRMREEGLYCSYNGKRMKGYMIPDWCPLEDV